MRKTFVGIAVALACLAPGAWASEYCVDRYEGEIQKVDGELAQLLKRQAAIDARVGEIYVALGKLATALVEASQKNPPDVQAIQKIGAEIAVLNREKAALENEGYGNQDRIVALKGNIPASLQGQLRGCIQASAPLNTLVNLAIQSLAILTTGGAALALPPKALYIDMSAVLNGYPTGGEKSVINQAREAALKALPFGLGNPRNDVGKTIRDPGRIVRCIFGC